MKVWGDKEDSRSVGNIPATEEGDQTSHPADTRLPEGPELRGWAGFSPFLPGTGVARAAPARPPPDPAEPGAGPPRPRALTSAQAALISPFTIRCEEHPRSSQRADPAQHPCPPRQPSQPSRRCSPGCHAWGGPAVPGSSLPPFPPSQEPAGEGDPQPKPAFGPRAMQNCASSRADAAPRPSRRQGPGPAAEPAAHPASSTSRRGAGRGAVPRPARPRYLLRRASPGRGARSGAQGGAERQGGRRGSPAPPPPARPPEARRAARRRDRRPRAPPAGSPRTAPRPRPGGGPGTVRTGEVRGARPPPPGARAAPAAGPGIASPPARGFRLCAPRPGGDSSRPRGVTAVPRERGRGLSPPGAAAPGTAHLPRNRPCAPVGTPRVLLRVGIPESRRKRQHPQDLGCHVPLSFSYSAKYRPTLTGRGGGSQRPRRDPRRSSRRPRRASPRALASNGRVLPAKFSRMGTGLAVTWIRRPVCRTPAPLPPAPLLAPRKVPRCTHSPPLGHGGAAGGGDAAPGYWQRTIREPAPPPRVERKKKKKKKKKYAEEAPGARPGGGREGAAAAGGGVPAARLGSARRTAPTMDA
ncbi:basic proline-rich protein-like [Melozone crissalis]|uniref:basic proline-rich protein-like n=1 Tax=Melozone crissalis TaxID=40204 RepID=UPI0023D9DCA0|nr:basic proline-rich protein-like [Melozone crissalis]